MKLWYEVAVSMAPPPDFAGGTDVGTNPDPDTAMLILEEHAASLHPKSCYLASSRVRSTKIGDSGRGG